MPALAAVAEPHDKRGSLARLSLKGATIHAMPRAIQPHPAAFLRAARLQRADHSTVRHAAVFRELLRVHSELNQIADVRVGVIEEQPLDHEMLATDSQCTVAGENGLSGRGRLQRDRFRIGSPDRDDFGITPLTLAQDQVVAGLR